MDLGLTQRRALVMGGGRGLGYGIARALAAEGATVALVSRNEAALAAAARTIEEETGARALAVAADLADRPSIGRAVDKVTEEIGGIDILVNNSGGPPASGAAGVQPDIWSEQFDRMVLSIIHLTDLVLPGMRSRGWGRVLTVASSGVVEPNPLIGLSNSLRSCLVGWSKTLAGEVAVDGVTANLLLPGRIATDRMREIDEAASRVRNTSSSEVAASNRERIPMRRYGTAEEFGAVAAFLASDRASYVTGSMMRIDGGAIRSI